MKKFLSILLCLALVSSFAVMNVSAKRLYGEEFVALQVKEGNCELIDNSATNHLAHNQPIGWYTSTHGTGCNSQGDAVKFPNVKLDKQAKYVAIKGGYNNASYPATNVEFWVYLNKIDGEPIAKIPVFDYETASPRIEDQIFKYAPVSVEPGTYDVYIVTETQYSGSFSEVAFLYEDGELDESWKDHKDVFEVTETGEEVQEEIIPYSYTGENIYYISDNGDDMNDGLTPETPIKSMIMATLKFGEATDNTLVIVDSVTFGPSSIPACTIVGNDSAARLNIDGDKLVLGGDVTFKNIRIRANVAWTSIYANGYKLVMDENVRTEKGDGIPQFPSIYSGASKYTVNSNSEVVVKSGEWHYIVCGSYQGNINGNSHVTVHDGVAVRMYVWGDAASDEHPANGTVTFKFIGEEINATSPSSNPMNVMDNMYLDLTEFTGKQVKPNVFADVDCLVLTDPTLIPEDALPGSLVTTEDEGTEGEGTEGEGTGTEGEGTGTEGEGTEGEGTVDEKTEEEKKAEEEAKKAEEEKKAAEEAAKKAEEEKKAAEEAAKKAEEEAAKKAEEEAAKKAEEEAAKKAEEEAAKKAEEEANKTDDTAADEGGMSPII